MTAGWRDSDSDNAVSSISSMSGAFGDSQSGGGVGVCDGTAVLRRGRHYNAQAGSDRPQTGLCGAAVREGRAVQVRDPGQDRLGLRSRWDADVSQIISSRSLTVLRPGVSNSVPGGPQPCIV